MRRSKVLKIFAFLVLLLIGGYWYALHRMKQDDKHHVRFYEAGKTIATFLSDYAGALKKAAAEGDTKALAPFFADAFEQKERGLWVYGPVREVGGVHARDLTRVGDDHFQKADVLRAWSDYLSDLNSVTRVKCKIDLISDLEPHVSAELTVKFILDGTDTADEPLQDRHFYRWRLVNAAETPDYYDWKIQGDGLVEGIRVIRSGPVFEQVDLAAAGIDYVHRRDPKLNILEHGHELKFGVIEHAMGGLSAADYNNDGLADLFFADGVESKLYRNETQADGSITFVDVTEAAGLAGIDQASAALFADFDNDGDRDLYVVRYLAPNLYYRRDGERFTEHGQEMGLNQVITSVSATLLDFDNDGYLDIYVGVNGNAYEAFPRLPMFARNGEPNRLLHNQKGQGFKDVTKESGTGDSGWTLAVAAGDYNNDGFTDLVCANDFGRKNLYRNNGDGTFDEVAKDAGTLDFSGGMGVLFADFNDDGLLDLYTSNIKSNTRWFGKDVTLDQYMRNVARTRYVITDMSEYMAIYDLLGTDWRRLGLEVGEGNSLFYNNGDETFRELKDSHTNQAGWGWAVAAFDYDNDTDLDIYAANGWISNKPGTDL
ncbi:MAG: VCBS repeat-containing protein [Acidobacteriota bacterium]|nr:VCBS repeat-containing protein [Acidobacteriota bacterium]